MAELDGRIEVMYRRDKLLAYVDDLVRQWGEEEVLPFP